MSTELNKYIVRNFFAAIDRDGMQAAKQFLSSDFSVSISGIATALDREGYIRYGNSLYEAISGLKHNIIEIAADGDRVEVRVQSTGVHAGRLHGIPPNGKRLTLSVVMIFRLVGGKIEEGWIEVDIQDLLRQSGAYAQMAVSGIPERLKNYN